MKTASISILIAASIFAGAIRADGATILGPVVNSGNGHSYYLLDNTSWQSGEASAVSLGGHLTTIRSLAEQNWVFSTFGTVAGTSRSLWIGLREQGAEGNYLWVSGEPVTYTNWFPGQPDNTNGTEAFVYMQRTGNGFGNTPGTWNDLSSPTSPFTEFNPFGSVAEVVPEPATGAFIISAAFMLFTRRRRHSSAH